MYKPDGTMVQCMIYDTDPEKYYELSQKHVPPAQFEKLVQELSLIQVTENEYLKHLIEFGKYGQFVLNTTKMHQTKKFY